MAKNAFITLFASAPPVFSPLTAPMVYLLDSAFLSSQTTGYLWTETSCEMLLFVSEEEL